MSLNAIGILVFPALAIFSLYVIHYAQSPTASKAQVQQRIKRYCIGMFLVWFVVATFIVGLLASGGLNEMCQNSSQVVASCIFNADDSLQLSVVFGAIGLMALIPTLILYIGLRVFHRVYAGYEKPKGKPKINQDSE